MSPFARTALAALLAGSAGLALAQPASSPSAMPGMSGMSGMPGTPGMSRTPAASAAMPATRTASGTAATATANDRRFVHEAGAGGAAEIALGKMAAEKATRPEVKQFGQQMVDEHTQVGEELNRLATPMGMTPPGAPKPAQQRTAERLGRLTGDAFDRAYLNQMVLDHRATIALFQGESRSGRNPELMAFATKTLPALRGHLTMVRELQTKGGPMNRADNASGKAMAPAR